ncbi:MAG: HEAT repeat domain-containing protein [Promethearchaeota archaeon]|nr:MAG: HEAT repeat domain-containing protein [Candidatus Lokiarchaeota archaeon]
MTMTQERDIEFNKYIKDLFHNDNWQERAEAARNLGLMEDGRATNMLCRALRTEEDHQVINRIIQALGRIKDAKATMRIIEKLEEKEEHLDKYRIMYIIESLMNIKDKRALVYIGPFLKSEDEEIKETAEKAFDVIEPNWRKIIEDAKNERSIQEIFKIKL